MEIKILLSVFLKVSILPCSINERGGPCLHCFVCSRNKYGPMRGQEGLIKKEITRKGGREERPERKAVVEYTGGPAKQLQNS